MFDDESKKPWPPVTTNADFDNCKLVTKSNVLWDITKLKKMIESNQLYTPSTFLDTVETHGFKTLNHSQILWWGWTWLTNTHVHYILWVMSYGYHCFTTNLIPLNSCIKNKHMFWVEYIVVNCPGHWEVELDAFVELHAKGSQQFHFPKQPDKLVRPSTWDKGQEWKVDEIYVWIQRSKVVQTAIKL